jgi:quinohemoprotein ethanol dehydrogenase
MSASRFAAASLALLAAAGIASAALGAGLGPGAADVDGASIVHANRHPGEWLTYGRTYSEQRYSPLTQINDRNVGRLGLGWYYDIAGDRWAQESTPLIVGGVMYLTTAWSRVVALDAASGRRLWVFDPHVPRSADAHGCCGVANRGVAVWRGRVYVGTYDGRLIALDSRSGMPLWSVRTADYTKGYTITGAPIVVTGRVIIGNGGGEFATRGYVTAYDARTGKEDWRFYTVPGRPGAKDEATSDSVLDRIARPTWHGKYWKFGGGGNVWDAMSYDPALDLLYIGTGNGSPWNGSVRGPGDNLFITSIVALRPQSGRYVWHFQEVPRDVWDYDADQQIILADIRVRGTVRHVLMQAPKDGIFYVLDRATGRFISGRPYTPINWARGLDSRGRPIEDAGRLYDVTGKPALAMPGAAGGHNWQPMSYDPATGLVYLPVSGMAFTYAGAKRVRLRALGWNTGDEFAALPENPQVVAQIRKSLTGALVAWNPVTQRAAWRVPLTTPWNGGVVATAGNVVFQGDGMGRFSAYRATDGARLWSVQTHTGIVAPPITYEVGGRQYVAVETGWGGAFALAAGQLALDSQVNEGNVPRLLVFRLGGTTAMPAPPPPRKLTRDPPPLGAVSAATVALGRSKFQSLCSVCHGDSAVSGGVLPDLRYAAALGNAGVWQHIVHGGLLEPGGMVSFAGQLSRGEIEAIRAYVIYRANQTKGERAARPY